MLCHAFSLEEPVIFELLCTELLSAQRTSSLRYFSSGIDPGHFENLLRTSVFLPLLQFWIYALEKGVQAQDQGGDA